MKNLLSTYTLLPVFVLLFESMFGQTNIEKLNLQCDTSLTEFVVVSAPNSQTIWGAGEIRKTPNSTAIKPSQSVTRSTDGGLTWSNSVIPTPTTNWIFNSFEASDENFALATFYNGSWKGKVYKTIDGGTIWTDITSPAMYSYPLSFANWSHAFSNQELITMGDPTPESGSTTNPYFEIWKTSDGGINWIRVPSPALPSLSSSSETGFINSYAAQGDSLWFSTTNGRCIYSFDKGTTWSVSQTPLSGYIPILLIEPNGHGVGYYAGLSSTTTDFGKSWSPTFLNTLKIGSTASFEFYLFDADYIPNAGILVGVGYSPNSSFIYSTAYSLDDGKIWHSLDTGVYRTTVDMVNLNIGYFGARNASFKADMWKYNDNFFVKTESPEIEQFVSSVAPNPANNFLTFSLETNESVDLVFTLYNADGHRLKQEVWEHVYGQFSKGIETSKLPNGVYFANFTSVRGNIQHRIVIMH